jgi:hypothetical protein
MQGSYICQLANITEHNVDNEVISAHKLPNGTFLPFLSESILVPTEVLPMSKPASSVGQDTIPSATTRPALQGPRSRPEQVAAFAEAERQRAATSTYQYLFSTELKAPDC